MRLFVYVMHLFAAAAALDVNLASFPSARDQRLGCCVIFGTVFLASSVYGFSRKRKVGILGRGGGLDRQPRSVQDVTFFYRRLKLCSRGVFDGVVETRFGDVDACLL
jgi:hypothetical protein